MKGIVSGGLRRESMFGTGPRYEEIARWVASTRLWQSLGFPDWGVPFLDPQNTMLLVKGICRNEELP